MNKRLTLALSIVIIGVTAFYYSSSQPKSETATIDPNQAPQVVSTNPEKLDNATILPNQSIEITFDRPLENTAEFRTTIEPVVDYRVDLSEDRKTAKFIFSKPLDLGAGYSLTIKKGSKFEGKKEFEDDKVFHFRTIEYRGV